VVVEVGELLERSHERDARASSAWPHRLKRVIVAVSESREIHPAHPIGATPGDEPAESLVCMEDTDTRRTDAEILLRALAAADECALQSVVAVRPVPARAPEGSTRPGLPAATIALVHLAALLAGGGSTTSLRWAVELALRSGAHDDEIVEVLAIMAAVVGSARVVAAAPRLALAIGYDIEVDGWDGN
jgi:4-carboxymuconolactone decarboxylase